MRIAKEDTDRLATHCITFVSENRHAEPSEYPKLR